MNIMLWIGATIGIFAMKLGFAMGIRDTNRKRMSLILSLYLVLFIIVALMSGQLIGIFEPALKTGLALYILIATEIILWGFYVLGMDKTARHNFWRSLLLIIPCPACLTAILFSIWVPLNIMGIPAFLVGLGLGIVFCIISLFTYWAIKFSHDINSLFTRKISLGLAMITAGIFLIASLFLPAKIEEAKSIYGAFITENGAIPLYDTMSVLGILLIAMLIGFIVTTKHKN